MGSHPVMQLAIVLALLLVPFGGQWMYGDTIEPLPLTDHHASMQHATPESNTRSHPAYWDASTSPAPCSVCGQRTEHDSMRHIAWWSGNATDVRWMQSVRQCRRCRNFNVHEEHKLGERVVGDPHRLVYPTHSTDSLGPWLLQGGDEKMEQIVTRPETNPSRQLSVHGASCPICASSSMSALANAHFQFYKSAGVWFHTLHQEWQFVRCSLCNHGSLVVRTRYVLNLFGEPVSTWLLACADVLWSYFYVVVLFVGVWFGVTCLCQRRIAAKLKEYTSAGNTRTE